MASEIQAQAGADLTVYAVVRNPAGQVWQTTTSTFVAFVDANIDNYDIPLVEQGTSSGYYVGDFPAAVTTAGRYPVVVYTRAGGSPAVSDRAVAEGAVDWTGVAEVNPDGTYCVTLDEVKSYLRIDGTDEDTQLLSLIAFASDYLERETQQTILTTAKVYYLDSFPDAAGQLWGYAYPYSPWLQSCGPRTIRLPFPPLASVQSVKYLRSGSEVTFDPSNYTVDAVTRPGRIVLNSAKTWPADCDKTANAVRVYYTAGYGDASAVPTLFKQAALWLIAHAYEQREPTVSGVVQQLPFSLRAVIESLMFREAIGA